MMVTFIILTTSLLVMSASVSTPPAKTSSSSSASSPLSSSSPASPFSGPTSSLLSSSSGWVDQEGKSFSLSQKYEGKVLLVFVGYTSCPTLCPMITGQMKQLEKQLQDQKLSTNRVQILFITVDAQDTPLQLKVYAQKHHLDLKRWTLAQAPLEVKTQFANGLGLSWDSSSNNTKAQDHLRHSFSLVVLNSQGQVFKSYPNIFNLEIEKVGSEIASLTKAL